MKITVESTTKIVEVNGVPCRVWQGTTERGIPMIAYVTSVAVDSTEDLAEFEADLEVHAEPTALDVFAWPNRIFIDHGAMAAREVSQ